MLFLNNKRNNCSYNQTCDGTLLVKPQGLPGVPESFPPQEGEGWGRCLQLPIHSRLLSTSRSSYLVGADNVREAAKEAFIFMITFHQEMEVFLWL